MRRGQILGFIVVLVVVLAGLAACVWIASHGGSPWASASAALVPLSAVATLVAVLMRGRHPKSERVLRPTKKRSIRALQDS
ncbi:MAG TPA: hypothetical protein ENK31_06130 [Nannocystis exedens]|nr:hypothetical protein [Nannocystis exedens]